MKSTFLEKAPGNEILDRCRRTRHELQKKYKTFAEIRAYADGVMDGLKIATPKSRIRKPTVRVPAPRKKSGAA